MNILRPLQFIILGLAVLLPASALDSFRPRTNDARKVDLTGSWLFKLDPGSKEGVGRKENWQATDYDDSQWQTIKVGASWESQGHNYNGIAWYRQRVFLPKAWAGQTLSIDLGKPDDRGTVWINGRQVAEVKKYGPHFSFVLTGEPLKFGAENVIAIRIADWYKGGGLGSGKFAVERFLPFKAENDKARTISLNGAWRFQTDSANREGVGLEQKWMAPEFDDRKWNIIRVGQSWERQGYNYNGVAWYRQRVILPKAWEGQSLAFRLGRPDDKGVVWVNGVQVAEVKKYGPHFNFVLTGAPLKYGEENVIAVRLSDWYMYGGLNAGSFDIERLLPFAHRAEQAEAKPKLKLSVTDSLKDDILSDTRWEYGWRDAGTSDTRPKMSAARKAFRGEDAVAMNVWYPNSSGEFVDYTLKPDENGSVWRERGDRYLSFWYKTTDTEGEIQVRINKGKSRWKSRGVIVYGARVFVKPGDWTQVILPFSTFHGRGKPLTDTAGLDTISLGYRNHELQRPGTILFANFEVGSFAIDPAGQPISLDGLWRFKLDDHRPDGTPRDMKDETDKAGYGVRLGWHKPEFDDAKWGVIRTGSDWESQGYNYNGPAWYRQQVMIPADWSGRDLILKLGQPDDRGEIYWNGEMVQEIKSYGPYFHVRLKPEQIKYGALNTMAVRIVDWYVKGGMTKSPFTIGPEVDQILIREKGKPDTTTALDNFEMGPRPGKDLEVVIRLYGRLSAEEDLVVDYRLTECFHRSIKDGTIPLTRLENGDLQGVITLTPDEARMMYYGEWISTRGLLRSPAKGPIFAFSRSREKLQYEERDRLALPVLPETYEDTPYGKLKLIDVIDCSVDPDKDPHPYKEGGIRDGWVGRRAYATWKRGITIKEHKGRKYREANNNEHFLYRVGRGKLKPHQAYLLRVLYPDNAIRYQAMHIKAGRNYQGTGFRSGAGADDPWVHYPQTGEWQWYDHIVMNDWVTYGYQGARRVSSENGFWVAFYDVGRCYAAGYDVGPAAAEIRLYEIEQVEQHYPVIRKPDGLPQRILMSDWERLPDRVPYDMARSAKFLGLNAVGQVFLKWGGGCYFDAPASGYGAPSPSKWNSAKHSAEPGEPRDNAQVYNEYLAATKKAGMSIIPRMEYGGGPKLPKEARVVGPDGKIDRCGRYCSWGANLLHPATWKEMEWLLDDMIGNKIKENPHIIGLLYRMRQDRMKCSYGKRDVELFCKETGRQMPKGDAKAIAQWAAKTMKKEYDLWWQGKHRDFLIRIRDKLKSYRPDLRLFYYNWDPDGWNLGGYRNTPKDWSDYYNVNRARDWYQRVVRANQKKYADADYLKMATSFKEVHWNLNTSLYKDVKDIHLFAPVHWRYLADNPTYLNYFRTGSGMAMCNMFNYEEKVRTNIQNDNFQTSEMTPAGKDFAMAEEILACFHVDPNVITWTTYTYGRGFADVHRRFAQAFLALPDMRGKIVSDATAPVDDDVRVRTYDTKNGVYVGVVSKKMRAADFTVSVPATGTTIVNLVTGTETPVEAKDGKISFVVKSNAMELNSFLVE